MKLEILLACTLEKRGKYSDKYKVVITVEGEGERSHTGKER